MISLPDHIPDLRRLNGFRAVLLGILGCIVLRLWYLQLVKGPELTDISATQSVKTIRRMAPRGTIVDRTGRILASNRLKFVVSLAPDDAKKYPQVLPRLAQLLGASEDALRDKVLPPDILKNGKKIVVRGKPFDPIPLDRDVKIDVLSQIEEQRLDLPGVVVSRDPVRYYKDGATCAHVLGVTDLIHLEQLKDTKYASYHGGDYVGITGLEKFYESELRGQDGGQYFAVDARGRTRRSLGADAPIPGHTLRLSLDMGLQQRAYELMKEQFDGKNPLHPGKHPGAVVALDPNNGEVLAMVSMPAFDLNNYASNVVALNSDKTYIPLYNRAISVALPCGSPFKLVTAAAGLETGNAGPGTNYFCPGSFKLGKQTFRCDEVHRNVDFEKAIGASCNVYFYHVGLDVQADVLASWADRFGLGKKTGIDLPMDRAGQVPSPAIRNATGGGTWYRGETANMSIGQGGLLVTPMQLADYTAAIANGGTLWRPHVVQEILDATGSSVRQVEPEARGKLGVKPDNLRLIVAGMRRAMQKGGTAYASAIPDLDVAGKTGTVEIARTKQRNSMFVCFAPVDHPKIAIAVMVEGGGFGSETAAPIGRKLLGQYFHKKLPETQTYIRAKD